VPHDTYPAWQAFALAVGIAITFLLFAWLALRNKDIH
jgi:hypothetical protein